MVQFPMNICQDDVDDVWMGRSSESLQESTLKETNQESTSVDVQVAEDLPNTTTPTEDHDLRHIPKVINYVGELATDAKNTIYAKIVNHFLSFMSNSHRCQYTLALCLMVPQKGFKDMEGDGSETVIYDSGIHSNGRLTIPVVTWEDLETDSRIHSNGGPTIPVVAWEDLETDSPPQIEAGNHSIEIQDSPGDRIPVSRDQRPAEGLEVRADGTSHGRRMSAPRAANPFPLQLLQPGPRYGIRIGDKHDLINHVLDLGTQPVDSGIFLNEYGDLYGISGGKDYFTIGDDYAVITRFQQGRGVYLCCRVATGMLFVTKLVPLIHEDETRRPGETPQQVYRLQHRQQVELVVGQQDSCAGLAKVHGIIKRFYGGKEFAEIFMEYCTGGSLQDNLVSLRSLTMLAKWRLAQKILDIVEHLHKQTIIHGDLKLSNMMFRSGQKDIAVIDFESGKHPNYRTNMRATYIFLPPWFRRCIGSRDFSLLKTMDMWSVGIMLLNIVFGQQLWGQEYSRLLHCDSCESTHNTCLHMQAKFLRLMEASYPAAIRHYLPCILPTDDPIQKRLACVIHGLLSVCGPQAQLNATEAKEALEESKVALLIKKDGSTTIPPLIVEKGMTIRAFIRLPQIQLLKSRHSDLADGFYFTCEKMTTNGIVKEFSVTKTQQLTESGILHVYPPVSSNVNLAVV